MNRWIVLFYCVPSIVLAQVPDGFEDLFAEEEVRARVSLNDQISITVPATMGMGSATIMEQSKAELVQFLERNYVSRKHSGSIVAELITGVSDSIHCPGRRATCQVADSGRGEVQYVVVNEQNTLRILVPDSAMVSVQNNKRYINQSPGRNALVMHNRLSINGGSEGNPQAYYQNEAVLGMFGGYLQADLNATTDENNSEGDYVYLDELAGHYLNENHRLKLGFTSENVPRIWNGTAFLDTREDLSVLEAAAGTTRELEFVNDEQRPRIYFSVGQAGRLFVRREDGTPVLERNVTAGQHFVSYNDLPSGISTLTFEVRAGERVLYEEVHKVYNTPSTRMTAGDWDYFVAAGKLYDQEVVHNELLARNVDDYQHDAFSEFRVATQLNDDFKLGLGVFNTSQDYFAKAALAYQPTNDISVEALYGQFGDESYYLQSTFRLFGLNLNASRFADRTDTPEEMTFSNYLFGYGSNRELSANYVVPIGQGRAYFNYSYLESELLTSVLIDNDEELLTEYESVTAGYTFSAWRRSTVDVSAMYTNDKDDIGIEHDELTFRLSVSIPLSRSAYASYSVSADDDQHLHRIAAGNSYTLSPDASVNMEVGASYDNLEDLEDDFGFDASVSGNYDNDYLTSSAFVYGDEDNFNVSANLNSTTVVTSNGVYQTRDKADAYLVVENTSAATAVSIDEGQRDFLTVANLKGNGQHAGRILLDSDEVIHPLERYREYQVTLDEAASDYHNLGDSNASASSYPGTLIRLDVDMREIKSYISTFDDIEGNPVNTVECRGQGCVDVEVLAEGVFKFRVSAGMPFELRTSAQCCLIPSPETFSTQNLGRNFCMPVFDEERDGLRLSRSESGAYYYYVGEFIDETLIKAYEQRLEGEPMTFIRRTVGGRTFLFIEAPERLVNTQREVIVALGQYALEETLDTPTFVTR
ncbi:hypothetical protein C9I98_20020 [Photobacterium sanctipauli]|uniref:Pilus assembly protein C-terminal domain-containing protein n=1 Tax=Photobacterium sanctipauli TaxID=1342794 RepID=A0A2T3NMV0_9GAMM|nr:CS1-pili formation C-terminal domain-containing protein [Photobacterium sanctipauli]PSW16844.1 hypothetical protein C9I98_20020 [Photobacterium sanctipauli]